MIFTSSMRLLAAVAFSADADAIAAELLRLGALETVSVQALPGDWTGRLVKGATGADPARLRELRKRAEGFMLMADPPLPKPDLEGSAAAAGGEPVLQEAEQDLDGIAAGVTKLRERQKNFQDEIIKLEEMQRQLDSFDELHSGVSSSSAHSFLSVSSGHLPANKIDELSQALEGIPSLVLPSTQATGSGNTALVPLVVMCMKRDAVRLKPLLEKLGWTEASIPEFSGGKAEALRQVQVKISVCRSRQQECSGELQQFLGREAGRLGQLWGRLRVQELLDRVKTSFGHTEHTVLFSGWIPSGKVSAVERGIRAAAAKGCSIEWLQPGQGEAAGLEAPVEMKNPSLLKPFEGLVRNFAVPEYGSIDPTPFVAVAYLLMFGLMFGDAGHGLVVALVGLLGTVLARKRAAADGLYRVMTYCGLSAVCFGVLFGSYFGFELLPALWFDYHAVVSGEVLHGPVSSVYGILGLTIKVGILVLATGFVLNWINLVRKRDWFKLFLDKGGLLGGWIYAAGAWVAFYFVEHQYKALPSAAMLIPLLAVPTLLLLVKPPLEYVHHGRRKIGLSTLMTFLMEWIVEVLEVYSGYLSNTLSFMRVAGLGIAHVSLMSAFFQIARMVNPDGGFSVAAILILVAGNVLVIALEGLSAGIQSLRLNYYEFFSRYFNGSGRAYSPVSFRSKE